MKALFAYLLAAFVFQIATAQESSNLQDSLRNVVKTETGFAQLQAYHRLIELNLDDDAAMAMRDARRVERLAEEILDPKSQDERELQLLMRTEFLLGEVHENRRNGLDARTAYIEALAYANRLQSDKDVADIEAALIRTDALPQRTNKIGRIFGDALNKGEEGAKDLGLMTNIGLADLNEKRENYEAALKYLQKVVDRLESKGDTDRLAIFQERINAVNEKLGIPRPPDAPPPPPTPPDEHEFIVFDDSLDLVIIDQRVEEMKELTETSGSKDDEIDEVAVRSVVLEQASDDARSIRLIAEQAEETNDPTTSLSLYKQYLALEKDLMLEQRKQDSALAKIQLLQQKNLLQAENSRIEIERQLAAKRSMAGGLGLAGALLASIILLYRNKRKDHNKLAVAYDDLSKTQDELQHSQERVQNLLKQHVSGAIADELLASKNDAKVERKFVCIMFLDIRNFTPFAESQSPENIISYQNKVFGFMIETIHQYGGIVNQILGDGFMATFGAPVSSGNDCLNAYQAARKIIELLEKKNQEKAIPPTRIGIGLHAGNVVAGNVGTDDRRQYSITGNPVIVAARLEQLNKEFGSSLVLSKEVYQQIPEKLRPQQEFTTVDVKGRSTSMEVMTMS